MHSMATGVGAASASGVRWGSDGGRSPSLSRCRARSWSSCVEGDKELGARRGRRGEDR